MSKLEVGQVLWLRLAFERGGKYSEIVHPYLIARLIETSQTIEIVNLLQFDSIKDGEWRLLEKEYMTISANNPKETVISKDSYIHLDKIIRIKYFDDLVKFRDLEDKLSKNKLEKILFKYDGYIRDYNIPDKNIMTFEKEDILEHNKLDN